MTMAFRQTPDFEKTFLNKIVQKAYFFATTLGLVEFSCSLDRPCREFLTRFSKSLSFLLLFAVSVKWAKSGGGIKIEIWHESGRHESSESLDHTILHKISVRIQP